MGSRLKSDSRAFWSLNPVTVRFLDVRPSHGARGTRFLIVGGALATFAITLERIAPITRRFLAYAGLRPSDAEKFLHLPQLGHLGS